MMGKQCGAQAALFYEFDLEVQVPPKHLLRLIDRFVDLDAIRRQLEPCYSTIGRPSIDPKLMIRMLLVGYCFGIRSERRLCEEVHLNLAYRWFCKLDLTDPVPDHSTFSKNRHGRFRECDLFRNLFEHVLSRCIAEGLVGGEAFGVGASLIKADANREDGIEPKDWVSANHASRATSEYLDTLDDSAFGAATQLFPNTSRHPIRRPAGQQQTAARRTSAIALTIWSISITRSSPLRHASMPCRAAVDVEPSVPIRQAENKACRDMIERTMDRFDLYPARLAGDTGYGTAEMLGWLVYEHGIQPHIPVFDKSARHDGTFSRNEFRYDHEQDVYHCPAGHQLQQYKRAFKKPRDTICSDGMRRYRASKQDCQAYALKHRCVPNEPSRKVLRSVHEGAREMALDIAKTDAYVVSRCQRKKVEMLFAHLKRILKLDRLRLRGPNGARDEFHLAATAQNLRKLAKLVPQTA